MTELTYYDSGLVVSEKEQMPRQARLDCPGTLHHVILRGIEGKEIVDDEQDRKDFVSRLGRCQRSLKIDPPPAFLPFTNLQRGEPKLIRAKKSRNVYAEMLDIEKVVIAGIKWSGDRLWVATPEGRCVATHSPSTGATEKRLTYPHEIWDLCPGADGLWLMTGGGRLGRQLVLWSLERGEEVRKFNCPDGAGAGVTLYSGKLWVTHRHNRRLFCLDPQDGKVNWVIRTENETFSPAAYGNELWLVEADPGPLGHWDETGQSRYFFSRYDPARERIVQRHPVPFIPHCMAFDGERFWYAERGKKGLSSMPKNPRQS